MLRMGGARTKDQAGKESERLMLKALTAILRRLYFTKKVMRRHCRTVRKEPINSAF